MLSLAPYWQNVQQNLFPYLAECLPAGLTEGHRKLVEVLEIVRIEEQVPRPSRGGPGCPAHDRRPLARAFLAKACYNFPTTLALWERLQLDATLRRLCGWETRKQVPSLATFSRGFAEFARTNLLDQTQAVLVERFTEETVVWHLSRDSTAIVAREQPAPQPKPPPPPPRKRGRPRKGEVRPPAPLTRLERQEQAARAETDQLLAELPRQCDLGIKKNAKGHAEHWCGYKFHVDTGDTGLPLLAVTTSASLHDSQAAIPMARKTSERVVVWYELMDAAYDAQAIWRAVTALGHVPIIDRNSRGQDVPPMEPDRAQRYGKRSAAERVNAWLKEDHGGRTVRVRGAAKVHTHLMFGLLVIFAKVVRGWVG
jgi:hypothetical protein